MEELDQFEEGQSDDDFSDDSGDHKTDLERKLNHMMRGDLYVFSSGWPIQFKIGQTFKSVY